MNIPADIPAEALPVLERVGYLEADKLHVGDPAPRLTLTRLEAGEPVTIGVPDAPLPTVLIFGSYT